MRSSAPPTLALAVLLLAAGAFGTWYMLATQDSPARGPSIAAEESRPDADKPAPLEDTPMDRAGETPVVPHTDKPVAPKPATTETSAETAPKAGTAKPGTNPKTEPTLDDLKAEAEKLAERLRNGELPGRLEGGPPELDDLFGGPQVDFTATISGTVLDTVGAPVAGASVYAEYSEALEQGDGNNRRVSIAIARSGDGNRGTPMATTDAAGNFSATINRKISEKVSLSVSLSAAAENYADSKSQRIALKNGDTKDGIKLTLRGAGSVSGRVVDASGRGVEGVKVTIGSGDGSFVIMGDDGETDMPGRGASKSATTDAAGNFSVTSLAEGRYKPRLRATGWRQVSGPTEVTVKPGVDTKCPADFVMAAAAGVKIKVTGPDGKAVQGYASVRFKEGATNVKTMSSSVGADGVISLNDTPVGVFTVEVRVFGYKPQTVNATIIDGQVCDLGTITVEAGGDEGDDVGVIFPGD